MEAKNLLGPAIKSIRKQRNMTQTDLSKITGYKQNTISQHEGQKRELNERDVRIYANAFNVTPQYLYDISNNNADIASLIVQNCKKADAKNTISNIIDKLDDDHIESIIDFAKYQLSKTKD